MEIKPELLDKLLEGIKTEEDLAGPGGLLKQITKALVERMLAGELTHHLGYEKHDVAASGKGNTRNGKSRKTLKGQSGEMEISVPRDRDSTFEPQVVRKHQTRWEGWTSRSSLCTRVASRCATFRRSFRKSTVWK